MPLVMFVLVDLGLNIVGQIGYSIYVIYKEIKSDIYRYGIIFLKALECSFSLSACLHVSACFLPLLNFLRACIFYFNKAHLAR